MIQELRIYRVTPGRMGDALARFRKLPLLFEKHGVRCVGRWQALAGQDGPAFIYMLAYRDFAEREERWASFYADEAWLHLRAATNDGEEMVEEFDLMFLKPNGAWTPRIPDEGATVDGVHELRIIQVGAGQGARAGTLMTDVVIPASEEAGGTIMLVADLLTGPRLPAIATMTRWPTVEAWRNARIAIEHDPRVSSALRNHRVDPAGFALGRSRSWLLDPVNDPLPRHLLMLSPAEVNR